MGEERLDGAARAGPATTREGLSARRRRRRETPAQGTPRRAAPREGRADTPDVGPHLREAARVLLLLGCVSARGADPQSPRRRGGRDSPRARARSRIRPSSTDPRARRGHSPSSVRPTDPTRKERETLLQRWGRPRLFAVPDEGVAKGSEVGPLCRPSSALAAPRVGAAPPRCARATRVQLGWGDTEGAVRRMRVLSATVRALPTRTLASSQVTSATSTMAPATR